MSSPSSSSDRAAARQPSRNRPNGRRPARPAGPLCAPSASRWCTYSLDVTARVRGKPADAPSHARRAYRPAGRPQGPPQPPTGQHRGTAARQAGVTLGGRRVRIRGPWSALGPYALVIRDPGGHERSRRVQRNDRSPHLHARTSAAGARPKRVRIPPDGCRGPAALTNEARVAWTGLTPCPSWSRRHQVGAAVVLTGRAISVPSEHDASGSPRSATDTADRLTSAPCITDARQHEW
jgi:hypothetical protein